MRTLPDRRLHVPFGAEATGSGTPLREYIWVDDMPLAVVGDLDTTPQIYYVHPDHLNRPLRMTDGAQTMVWDAVYHPFGEVFSITGSAALNLRFPGQYFLIAATTAVHRSSAMTAAHRA